MLHGTPLWGEEGMRKASEWDSVPHPHLPPRHLPVFFTNPVLVIKQRTPDKKDRGEGTTDLEEVGPDLQEGYSLEPRASPPLIPVCLRQGTASARNPRASKADQPQVTS